GRTLGLLRVTSCEFVDRSFYALTKEEISQEPPSTRHPNCGPDHHDSIVIQITRLVGNIPNTSSLFKTAVAPRWQYPTRFSPKENRETATHDGRGNERV